MGLLGTHGSMVDLERVTGYLGAVVCLLCLCASHFTVWSVLL